MNSIKARLVGDRNRSEAAKHGGRPRPCCETLEGRQLLNGAWIVPGTGMSPGAVPALHTEIADAPGNHAFTRPTLSATALADLKALEADTQTFQAEIKAKVPASLFDAVKADAAAIKKALAPTAQDWTGPHKDGHRFMPGNDPSIDVFHPRPGFQGLPPGANVPMTGDTLPAAVVTKLEAAGVSKTLIAQFETDAKALQTAIQKVDPALMAKIQTERQTFEKDAHPTAMHFDHIKAMSTPSSAKVG